VSENFLQYQALGTFAIVASRSDDAFATLIIVQKVDDFYFAHIVPDGPYLRLAKSSLFHSSLSSLVAFYRHFHEDLPFPLAQPPVHDVEA